MAPKYIFNYFDGPGRGEPIRLMFHAAGVEFTDNRMKGEEWQKQKTDTRRFPLGQMPTLEVDDKVIMQSQAIGRFVAKELGFYGNDNCDAAVVDQICEVLIDLSNEGIKIIFGPFDDETKKTKMAEFIASDKIKSHLGYLTNVVKSKNGGYFLGEKPSFADFLFYGFNVMFVDKCGPYLDQYNELKAVISKIENIENVKKYLDSRK